MGQIPVALCLFGRGINWWSLATHYVTSWSCTCRESPLWAKKTEQESGQRSRVRGSWRGSCFFFFL